MRQDRLLLVNAWPEGQSDLWCAPGGGIEPGQSLPENLIREIHEETGLWVDVGAPVLVNEFNDPAGSFHQIDIYFRCALRSTEIPTHWTDPEGVVTRRLFATQNECRGLRIKPDSLIDVAWRESEAASYDPLEPIVR